MKKLHKKLLISSISLLVLAVVLIIIVDSLILPNYVYAPELEVPEIVGMNQDDAIALLKEMKLNPIVDGTRFDNKFEKDEVIFQRPRS